jgi:hypothetical protein
MGLPNHIQQSGSAPALSLAVPQRDASTEQLHGSDQKRSEGDC